MGPAKITAILFLVALMFETGLQVNRERLEAVLKNYTLLAGAFVANFVVVPLLGVLAVRLFALSTPIATGVLLMAISPGVPFLVMAGGRKKGGSLGLAVALTFLMPLVSIVTVPITARIVLPADATLSTASLFGSLGVQAVSLIAGMLLSWRLGDRASKLERLVEIVVLLLLAVLLVVLAPKLGSALVTVWGTRGIMAIASVVIFSMITGWLCGGQVREYRRTLAFGTALRNIGLAAAIATSMADAIVTATVLMYLIVQFILTSILGVYFKRTVISAPQAEAK